MKLTTFLIHRFWAFLFLLLGSVSLTKAQTHFTDCKSSSPRASIVISTTAQVGVNGAGLVNGSEIAVFNAQGVCVGAVVWMNASLIEFSISEDNATTPEKDGLAIGDPLLFRIWDKGTNKEHPSSAIDCAASTDPSGNKTYKRNATYIFNKLVVMENGQTVAFSSSPVTSIQEGSTYTYNITTTGSSNAVLTLTAPTKPAWLEFMALTNGAGKLMGTAGDAQEGSHAVKLVVTNGTQTAEQSFSIQVLNAPPVVSNLTGSFSGSVGASLSFTVTASDPGNDNLTYSWNWGDGSAAQTGGATLAHTYSAAGKYNLVVTVTDSDGASANITREVTIGSVNSPPIFTSNPSLTILEGSPYSYNITTNDGDGDSRTITATTKPAWLTLADNGNGTATLSGLPTGAQKGPHNITLRVTDSKNASADQNFSITVQNANPIIASLNGTFTGTVGTTLAFTGSASDPGGDALTYTWEFGDGTPNQVGVNLTNISHAYTSAGAFTLRLTVSDPQNGTATQTRSVTISANNNNPPTFTSTPITAGSEGTNYAYAITATDADANQSLTFNVVTKPSWLVLNNTGNGTATLSGTPAEANEGANAVVIEVSDGQATARQTFEIIVSNLPPRIQTFAGTLSGTVGQTLSFSANATDPGNDALTYRWEFGDNSAAQSGIDLKAVTKSYSTAGTYTLRLTVLDADGAAVTETKTVTIGVNNATPVFTSVPQTTTPEGSTYTYTITTVDGDGDARILTAPTKPTWLTFIANNDGTATLSGLPLDAQQGKYPISLQVSDGKGGASIQNFELTVTNAAPVIGQLTGEFTGAVGANLSYQANATDAGQEAITYTWNWGDGSQPQSGVDLKNITHRYSNAGSYTLTLTVSDDDGGQSSQTRTVVVGLQSAPSFTSTPILSLLEGSTYTYAITTTGGNGSPLSISAPTLPAWLTLIPTANGQATLSGIPRDAHEGANNVVLEVSDGTTKTRQTFAINVQNALPVINNITGGFSGETGKVLNYSASASDPGNDNLTYTWNFGDGTALQNGVSTTHTYAQAGTYNLVLTVTDSDNAAVVTTRQVVITALGTLKKADLALAKGVSNAQPSTGSTIAYTLTLTNNGPDAATNIQVQDLLPAGLTYATHTSGQTYNAGNGVWYLNSLAVGATATLRLTTLVNPNAPLNQPINNIASILKSDQMDGNAVNNQANAVITPRNLPQDTDVALSTTISNTTPRPGEPVTQTIYVLNNGPATAQNLAVTVVLPPTLRYQGVAKLGLWSLVAQPGIGTAGGSIQLATPTLGINETASFQLNVAVSPDASAGSTISLVSGLSLANNDTTPLNNTNSIQLRVATPAPSCNLVLLQSNNNPLAKQNEPVDFTLALTNSSIGALTGVVVGAKLPNGVTYANTQSISTGAYTSTSGDWSIGTLAAGATATLVLRAIVTTGSKDPINFFAAASTTGNCTAQSVSSITPNETSSGQNGGVESNGNQADRLATAFFRQKTAAQSILPALMKEAFAPMSNAELLSEQNANRPRWNAAWHDAVAQVSTLAPFVPTQGPEGTTAKEVSPTWLAVRGTTNAREVYSVDYLTANQRRLGSVLVADSGTEVYDHTKYVCDRLGGGVLEYVQIIPIETKPFVLGKVTHPDGKVDYAVSFVMFEGAATARIDSRFARSEYQIPAGTARILNFQVWASSISSVTKLMQDILVKVRTQNANLSFGNSLTNLPEIYIRSAAYKSGKVQMEIVNSAGANALTVNTRFRDVESRSVYEWQSKNYTLPLNPNESVQTVTVPTGGFFDMSLGIYGNTGLGRDEMYLTDGQWGSFHATGQAMSFTVSPQPSYAPQTGSLLLERNASLSGTTSGVSGNDWASLYRYLQAGRKPLDLTKGKFKTLSFIASGVGTFQVEFHKAAMAGNWDQFRTETFVLTATPKTYKVDLSKLIRQAGGSFVGDDVEMLVFRILGNNSRPQNFAVSLQDVKFTGGTAVPNEAEVELPTTVRLDQNYPNPFNPTTTFRFALPQPQAVKLEIFDALGRKVRLVVADQRTAGVHEVPFDASQLPSGMYVYRLQAGTHALTRKMMVLK